MGLGYLSHSTKALNCNSSVVAADAGPEKFEMVKLPIQRCALACFHFALPGSSMYAGEQCMCIQMPGYSVVVAMVGPSQGCRHVRCGCISSMILSPSNRLLV